MSTWRMLQECQGTCEITTFSYKVQHNKKWINRVKIFQVESNLHTHTLSVSTAFEKLHKCFGIGADTWNTWKEIGLCHIHIMWQRR